MKILKVVVILTICGTFLISSCKKKETTSSAEEIQVKMQSLADSIYQSYNEKWEIDMSGIHFYISGPQGDFMTSSNITPQPTPSSHFRIASITKTFTAASIMLLHQEGKLNINDTIDKYLPDSPKFDIPYNDQITIKQLLQHRSGVFDISNDDIPSSVSAPYAGMKYEDFIRSQDEYHTFTFDELIAINAEHQLSTSIPDQDFFYSNTGYSILGKIIEEVSGNSYSNFIEQNFAIPLGLKNTYSPWEGTDTVMQSPFINSYFYLVGEGPIETSHNNVSIHLSEGNLISSPKDITNWIRLLLTGKAGINPSNIDLMKEMQIADEGHGFYGLGLLYDDLGYGHNGIHQSYVTTTRYNPENEISVLISANFIRFDPSVGEESIFELAYALRDAMHIIVKEYQE